MKSYRMNKVKWESGEYAGLVTFVDFGREVNLADGEKVIGKRGYPKEVVMEGTAVNDDSVNVDYKAVAGQLNTYGAKKVHKVLARRCVWMSSYSRDEVRKIGYVAMSPSCGSSRWHSCGGWAYVTVVSEDLNAVTCEKCNKVRQKASRNPALYYVKHSYRFEDGKVSKYISKGYKTLKGAEKLAKKLSNSIYEDVLVVSGADLIAEEVGA